MEKFPNIAKARMAALKPGPHPEAEQLSAFSENALGTVEREIVLAHLATCLDCRDVVGLAAAARSSDAPVSKPARAGFRWTTFQWAAVAASVAIVTIAVIVVGPAQKQTEQHVAGAAATRPEPSANTAAPITLEPKPASGQGERQEARPPAKKPDADLKAKVEKRSSTTAPVQAAGGGFGGGVYRVAPKASERANDEVTTTEKKEQAPPGSVAQSPTNQEYAYSTGATDTLVDGGKLSGANAPAAAAAQKQAEQSSSSRVADSERRDQQAKSANELSKDLSAGPSPESLQIATKASRKPNRSAAAQPNAAPATFSGAAMTAANLDSAPVLWRVASGGIQSSADNGASWEARTPAQDIQWTSVAAAGQQVWAGGKAGALYLSRDGGQSWTKISLSGDDTMAVGDVTAIRLISPGVVNVSVTPGGTWQSTDGGKSFRLLPYKR